MKNLKYHIIYWAIFYVLYCILHFGIYETEVYWYPFFIILLNLCMYIIPYYISLLFIIPRYWEKGKYSLTTILFFMSICFTHFFIHFFYTFFKIPIPRGDNSNELSMLQDFLFMMNIFILTLPFAFTLFYIGKIEKEIKAQQIIELENFRLEQSITQTELNNLKNQINPDFLFRKLNHFYQESIIYSPNLSKGIALLTDMMHYAIDEEDANGKVLLIKEIKHIHNFIEINQLRFDGRLYVDFEVTEIDNKHQIMPLVLITFVENAFKYGELFDSENPLKIQIRVVDNELLFSTFNLKRRGPTELSEGIGIVNTQRRLALGYPFKYQLNIVEDSKLYKVDLSLIL
ncbi:histidine kinase [Arcicella aurantiaca]|uniref:Histidine kinase n=1 Tax=Arcicella aurantiaca TaxID=591202 RepID=A0A316ECR8_9BACT|nr:histidine kinase [Arcicella aurantiaca]PWK27439.1 histidine kinase [Arcicella aurantiaca]